MSKDCNSENPVKRDGTSRQQRLLRALLPAYVAVDERKIDDLKAFVIKFAAELSYYDTSDNRDGNWVDFFFEKEVDAGQRTDPHYALFTAFLKLFKIAQDDLNGITEKHLEFYYRDVLQLKERPPAADQVFVLFKLAKHIGTTGHLVKAGTGLKAGKDATGVNQSYKLVRDIVVNKAQVQELKALFVNKADKFPALKNDYRIYASPVADSADGLGLEIETEEKSWQTFGSISASAADRQQAITGFAFASPVLFLAEGNRDITITLNLNNDVSLAARLSPYHLNSSFRIFFSGEKEWIEPELEEVTVPGLADIDTRTEKRILDFLNAAVSPTDIAGSEPVGGPVFDNPLSGYGDQFADYDIGLKVAQNIISKRTAAGGTFTSISQLSGIPYLGADKISDLIYSFSGQLNSIVYKNNQLIIKRTLTASQKAVVAYNQAVLKDPFKTSWPVVKIQLNTGSNANPYIYKILKGCVVNSAEIKVDVSQVKELVLQNDEAILDPAKPFTPFGSRPLPGSVFYIGSWELFQKKLTSIAIELKWHGLPLSSFQDYYKHYLDDTDGAKHKNDAFKVNLSLLDKKRWVNLGEARLFDDATATLPIPPDKEITISGTALSSVKRDAALPFADEFDTDLKRGFLKLELGGTDFRHRDYAASYTDAIIRKITIPATVLPNEPYTPVIKEISLNYSSSETLVLNTLSDTSAEEHFNERTDQFFHVQPFGVAEIHKHLFRSGSSTIIRLLPEFTAEGTLYIGLKDLVPPQNLSLLFQVAEGSSDPELEKEFISWSYLSDNNWIDFNRQDILSDSTNDLLTSGIINFAVPKTASKNNTLLNAGLYWLRASVTNNSAAISRLISVDAQAALAIFEDKGNDPERLRLPLPADKIKKLEESDSGIEKVSQPYSSFGGRIKEQGGDFYTRISERLRHKNRAITIWDYENLILQKFPETYKVKCLNHTQFYGGSANYSELAPGHVSLVVISNVRNKNAVDPLRPKTSKIVLTEIAEYISALNSPGAKLHVQNPVYEEVKVRFKVRFMPGTDTGYFSKELNVSIKAFLSPWAFQGSSDVLFGGKIHKSMILNHVENLSYVDFVTCFEMFHIVPGDPDNNPVKDVNEAIATTSASVIGSADEHEITVLETDDCACGDNEVQALASIAPPDTCGGSAAESAGIEKRVIGDDFIIDN